MNPKPFAFKATVKWCLKLKLGQIKVLNLKKLMEVKEEQVIERLASLQKRHAELIFKR